MRLWWYIPLALTMGLVGSRDALERRSRSRTHSTEKDWWLLFLISWVPLLGWLASAFLGQN